jgi:alanine-synthesizing transaminase
MNKIEQTRRALLKKGRKIINLSSGNPNDFGIYLSPAVLTGAFKKFTAAPAYEPDPKGSLQARKAVVRFYANRGLKISPDRIILTSGSSESYFHLFKMLARPGEKILFPRPSYPLFEEIAHLAEIECGFYNLDENDGWQIDCDNLDSRVRPDVKAIVLISPGNPTGAVLSEKTLRRVADIAAAHNLPVISDEVFSEYIFDGKKFPRMAGIAQQMAAKQPAVFTLNGVSKTYALPGLKLSWVVVTGPDSSRALSWGPAQSSSFESEASSKLDSSIQKYLDRLERSADAFLACNQVAQAMLPDIIKYGAPFIKSLRRHLQANRDLAVKILGANPDISFHIPEGGFYLFAQIRGLCDAKKKPLTDEDYVIALLKKHKIFAHPGYFYDYDKGVRILISLLLPADKLKNALAKIAT